MQTPTLTTERLLLREWTSEDLPDILRIFGDEETNHFLPWYPLKTMEEAAAFFAERLAPQADGGLHAALCLRESGEIIGYLNVSSEPACDLGYGLLGSHRGKGYVTEAALAVLDHLTAQGLPYVTATHDVENPKSGAVMQRLGMDYQYSYLEHSAQEYPGGVPALSQEPGRQRTPLPSLLGAVPDPLCREAVTALSVEEKQKTGSLYRLSVFQWRCHAGISCPINTCRPYPGSGRQGPSAPACQQPGSRW